MLNRKILFIFFIILFLCRPAFSQHNEYPFLNKNLSYKIIYPKPDSDLMRSHPKGTKYISIEYKGEKLSAQYGYYVTGKVTLKKLRLIEYDFLIKEMVRECIIPVDILHLFSEKQLYSLYRVLYLHYQVFKNMKVPQETKEIHKMYVKFMSPAKAFLDFEAKSEDIFKNTTIVYRILSGLNSYSNQKLFQKANLKLFNILKESEILPY